MIESQQRELEALPFIGCLVPVIAGVVGGEVLDLPNQQHGTRPYSPAAETVAVGDRTRPWEDPLAAVGTIRDHGNLQVAMLHADEDPEHRRRAIVDLDESEVMGRGSLARTIGKS